MAPKAKKKSEGEPIVSCEFCDHRAVCGATDRVESAAYDVADIFAQSEHLEEEGNEGEKIIALLRPFFGAHCSKFEASK